MDEKQMAKLLDEAAEKSLNNKQFRNELIKDANATIKKEYGKELPVKVTFHESTQKKLVFILPMQSEGELDDSELQNVSGGIRGIQVGSVMAYGCFPRGDDFPQISNSES